MIEQEKSIFQEWKNICPNLVKDGMVNPEIFRKSDPRVLLILKEVNDEGGGNWDLREFLRNGGRWQTWNTVTRWLKGITNIESNLKWTQLENISSKERKQYLKRLSVINLKKAPGGSSSQIEQVKNAASRDKILLNQQFELYNSDIIICGGTGGIVTECLDKVKPKNWEFTSRGIKYNRLGNGSYLFSYYHPQARIKESFLYYGLLDAIREVYP